MATAPAKSPLHNFPLTFLRWGNNSRCRRPASGASDSPEPDLPGRRSRPSRNRHAKEGEGEGEAEADDSALAAEQKPWNLRPRKALLSKAKNGGGGSGESGEVQGGGIEAKSTRSQHQSASLEKAVPAKEKKRMFLIELSKEEIEEDVFIMTGSRPVRRPRKRPKNVQKQLDNVFPGLWLVGVTADAFRIDEALPKSCIVFKCVHCLILCLLLCSRRYRFIKFIEDEPHE